MVLPNEFYDMFLEQPHMVFGMVEEQILSSLVTLIVTGPATLMIGRAFLPVFLL